MTILHFSVLLAQCFSNSGSHPNFGSQSFSVFVWKQFHKSACY